MKEQRRKREIRTLGEYQRIMSRFENCADGYIIPDLQLIVRIDAHRHGEEWDGVPDSDYPFHPLIVRSLFAAARYVMCSGFRVVYSFVHGDEISFLLSPEENASQRRRSKIVSLIASAGSTGFYKESGRPVLFHSKLSELPTTEHVLEYFLWQRKTALRNFFSRTLGILLLQQGKTADEIGAQLAGMSDEERAKLAAELGRSPDTITSYERFGGGLWWTEPGGKLPSKLTECRELPESDEDYLSFLEERIKGWAACPGNADEFEVLSRREPAKETRTEQGPLSAPPLRKPSACLPKEKFRLGSRGPKPKA